MELASLMLRTSYMFPELDSNEYFNLDEKSMYIAPV